MSCSLVKGKVLYKLGDHINTDVITPGKYLTSYEPEYLGAICLIDLDVNFAKIMKPGGILIAGENFGCGSSRETAPIALKAAGVKVIIAKEFARIFYRNALNIGLPCIVSSDASIEASDGDELEVELSSGTIKNITQGKEYKGNGIPAELLEQFEAGGLIPYLKKKYQKSQKG